MDNTDCVVAKYSKYQCLGVLSNGKVLSNVY